MLDTVKDILNACEHCGHTTLMYHSTKCPNEEHRKLAEALINESANVCLCDCCEANKSDCPLEEKCDKCSECEFCKENTALHEKLKEGLDWIADLMPLPHQDSFPILEQCIAGAKWMRQLILEKEINDDIPF